MGHHKSNLCAVRYAIHKASLGCMLRDCGIPPKSRCIPFIHDPRSCWYVARGRGVGVWWYQGKIKVPNRRKRRTFSIFSIFKTEFSEYWKMKHTRVRVWLHGLVYKTCKIQGRGRLQPVMQQVSEHRGWAKSLLHRKTITSWSFSPTGNAMKCNQEEGLVSEQKGHLHRAETRNPKISYPTKEFFFYAHIKWSLVAVFQTTNIIKHGPCADKKVWCTKLNPWEF